MDGKDGKDGINGLDGTGCTTTEVTNEYLGKTGFLVQCGDNEPVYIWNGKDGIDGEDGTDGINGIDGKDGINGTNGADGVSCYVQENADLTGFDVYCGGVKVGTLQNGQDGTNGVDGKDGVDGTGCTSTAVTDELTGKSGVQIQCGEAVNPPTFGMAQIVWQIRSKNSVNSAWLFGQQKRFYSNYRYRAYASVPMKRWLSL